MNVWSHFAADLWGEQERTERTERTETSKCFDGAYSARREFRLAPRRKDLLMQLLLLFTQKIVRATQTSRSAHPPSTPSAPVPKAFSRNAKTRIRRYSVFSVFSRPPRSH